MVFYRISYIIVSEHSANIKNVMISSTVWFFFMIMWWRRFFFNFMNLWWISKIHLLGLYVLHTSAGNSCLSLIVICSFSWCWVHFSGRHKLQKRLFQQDSRSALRGFWTAGSKVCSEVKQAHFCCCCALVLYCCFRSNKYKLKHCRAFLLIISCLPPLQDSVGYYSKENI